MLVSVLVPPLLGQEIHLLDYWDAGEVLDLMKTDSLSAGTGAPLFLASLLDHPACTPDHHALIQMSSLSGSARCRAGLVLRADRVGIIAARGYGMHGASQHLARNAAGPRRQAGPHRRQAVPGVDVRIVDDDGAPTT